MWVSININAVILEATFNQLDNQMVTLQRRVLFARNVLSEQHATRRSEYVPKERKAPRRKVAGRAPGADPVGKRERIVQAHTSMVRARDLVKKRSCDVYRDAQRVK